MSTEKFHYYLTYATFINANTGEINNLTFTQGYGNNKISKSGLNLITSQIEAHIKSKNPLIDPKNIEIKSVSYLGEMTEDEYNS